MRLAYGWVHIGNISCIYVLVPRRHIFLDELTLYSSFNACGYCIWDLDALSDASDGRLGEITLSEEGLYYEMNHS